MAIFVTGDTHGTIDIEKLQIFFENKKNTKDDYLIIAGDVGVCGFSKQEEQKTRNILHHLPVTVLWVDGNHENFDELDSYPIEIWNGGKVHFIEEDIIHLMRGQVYRIEGLKFFTFGGGYSIDYYRRMEGVSWFPQELPNQKEYEEGLTNLEANNFTVDYIISHTGPYEVVRELIYDDRIEDRYLRKYLQMVSEDCSFNRWYFGHYHIDRKIDERFHCLYNTIIELNRGDEA